MFLKQKDTGHLVEVLSIEDVYDPCQPNVIARSHAGQEMQDAETYPKDNLMFPSGEPLPLCWIDRHYHEHPLSMPAMMLA
jgi:hypothetical protein